MAFYETKLLWKRILAVRTLDGCTLLCLAAIAFVLRGAFFLETNTMAAPATCNVGDRVQGAADEVRVRSGSDPVRKIKLTADKMRKLIKPTTRGASLSAKHSVIRLR